MSSVLDRVRAHSRSGEIRKIEVPEWGEPGKPLVIHHHMVSLGRLAEINEQFPGNRLRQQAEVIVTGAMDEEGKPLFGRMDATELLREADPGVFLRIANLMMAGPPPEQAEKNSAAIQ